MENKFGARVKAAEQDPAVRRTNFDEVSLGFTEEQAIQEAQRCLNCKKPRCVTACPVSISIPAFIAQVAQVCSSHPRRRSRQFRCPAHGRGTGVAGTCRAGAADPPVHLPHARGGISLRPRQRPLFHTVTGHRRQSVVY